MTTNAEIAQYVEAALESFMGVVFLLWGWRAGGLIYSFIGRKSNRRRAAHRYMMYAMAIGAFFMGAFMWITVEGGLDCTTCRADGVNAEFGRQIGYMIGATSVVVALAIYGQFTWAALTVSAVLMMFTFTTTLLATFYGATTDLRWVLFVHWAFFIVLGAYNTSVSWGIEPAAFYANYVASFVLYTFVILDGLWLILSQQVTASFGLTTEAALYAAFGPGMFIIAGIILALTYVSTKPLFAHNKKASPQVPSYSLSPKARSAPPNLYGGYPRGSRY